jgi:hypothetical protein
VKKGEKSAKCKEDIHAEVSTTVIAEFIVYTRLKDSAKVHIRTPKKKTAACKNGYPNIG